MATPNVILNDEEIDLISNLIRAYRSAYGYDEKDGPNTTHGRLKRLERKMEAALTHLDTEFV
jgi:hypothetical protein